MRRRPDPHTRDLFASPEPVAVGWSEEVTGKGSIASKIARIVGRTLSDARDEDPNLTRRAIAALISERIGRDVSESTLDKYASEGAEDRVVPLDVFIALIGVTHGYEALGFIPKEFGFVVVEERYVDLIEIQQIEHHQQLLDARKATLMAKARARR